MCRTYDAPDFSPRIQTFWSGLSCAEPTALVRDDSVLLAQGGPVGASASQRRPPQGGRHKFKANGNARVLKIVARWRGSPRVGGAGILV